MATDSVSRDTVLTARLVVRDAHGALDFYASIFDAELVACFEDRRGIVVHAELRIGGTKLMLTEEDFPESNGSPTSLGGSPVLLHCRCGDPDALAERILASGGSVILPVSDRFHGAREGRVRDPFGHVWILGRRIEELADDDIRVRLQQGNG